MSNDALGISRICTWLRCTGNPGSMKRIVSFPGASCEQSRKAVKLPCIDPTVGMQPCGATPTSRNARMKREVCCLSSGMPNMLGYRRHARLQGPAFGFDPHLFRRKPRHAHFEVQEFRARVCVSMTRAMSPDWRIVAWAMSAMSMRSSAESSTAVYRQPSHCAVCFCAYA